MADLLLQDFPEEVCVCVCCFFCFFYMLVVLLAAKISLLQLLLHSVIFQSELQFYVKCFH